MAERPTQTGSTTAEGEGGVFDWVAAAEIVEPNLSSNLGTVTVDPAETTEETAPRRRSLDARRTTETGSEQNTVDSKDQLELIDSHIHLGGKSFSGQAELKGLTRGLGRATIASFLYYNAAPDGVLADKAVGSLSHFCRDNGRTPNVAACAMVLDLGFVAMKPTATTQLSRMGTAYLKTENDAARSSAAPDPLFYTQEADRHNSNYKYIWFPRDDASFRGALGKIADACKRHPGKLWPFVGFDPRRATGLDIVKEKLNEGSYVAVKLYSRTGWMPIHNRRMFGDNPGDLLDRRLDSFYDYLTQNDVAVLVHCSPTGFPPDDMFVQPWMFTRKRLARGAFVSTTGVACPNGYGQIDPVLWPPTFDGDQPTISDGRVDPAKAIEHAASELANYSVYMQLTTSPYSWEPVMTKHPALRLCLAHFGAEVGTYCTPARDVDHDKAWQTGCELHPYVAGTYTQPGARRGGWDRDRNFRSLFKHGVIRLISGWNASFKRKLDPRESLLSKVTRIILEQNYFENSPVWEQWLSSWEQTYPLTWHEKILEMVGNSSWPNLYTDIAYLTTRSNMFPKVFRPLVPIAMSNTAVGETLAKKLMIGSDWFMTEMESCSPRDFWKLVSKAFWPDSAEESERHLKRSILWEMWQRENAIRWLNLNPRFNNTGMKKIEQFYFAGKSDAELPGWWKSLKKHYVENRHLLIPPRLKAAGGSSAPTARAHLGTSATTATGAGRKEIALAFRPQEKGNWCWAAASQMMREYYLSETITQRALAAEAFGWPETDPDTARNWDQQHALHLTGLRSTPSGECIALPWDQIKVEIDSNRPFIFAEAKHYYVCYGYEEQDATKTVLYYDPLPTSVGAKGTMAYDDYVVLVQRKVSGEGGANYYGFAVAESGAASAAHTPRPPTGPSPRSRAASSPVVASGSDRSTGGMGSGGTGGEGTGGSTRTSGSTGGASGGSSGGASQSEIDDLRRRIAALESEVKTLKSNV